MRWCLWWPGIRGVVLRLPSVGWTRICSPSRSRLTRFLGDLASSRSPGTAGRVRTTLRGLFAYAVDTRRIVRSPAASVPVPRPDEETREVAGVSPSTYAPLLQVVAEQRAISEGKGANVSQHAARYADVTLVLGLTGLRMGELRGLRVCDVVSVPYPGLLVQRSHPQSAREGRVIERKRTKGPRSRLVPMLSEVQVVVGEWTAGKGPDDLLFASPEGSFLRSGNWRRTVHWDDTCQGVDLMTSGVRRRLCGWAAGVDVKTVAAWLGHGSTKLTLDTYGHWMGTDADRAAISRLEAVLGVPAGDGSGGQPGASGPAGRVGPGGSDV